MTESKQGYFSSNLQAEFLNGVLTLTVLGDIDHHSAGCLRRAADREIFDWRPKTVRLDLSRVAFMDSAGLGFILGRSRTAQQAGARFLVWHPTARILKLLRLAGTEKILEVVCADADTKTKEVV